jgi:gamma-glutamyl-gamma-aminobutyrate hydrolase PuuD
MAAKRKRMVDCVKIVDKLILGGESDAHISEYEMLPQETDTRH